MRKALIGIMALAAVACRPSKEGATVSKQVRARIDSFASAPPCPDAIVDELRFQEKTVYAFRPGTCGADMMTDVYDANGNLIGSLGGITGNMKINGENFEHASLIRTVWKK